jgi:hypothetical protein
MTTSRNETEPTSETKCPECFGKTVIFRGKSKWDFEYSICSRWQEPGHHTEEQIKTTISNARKAINPSGRWA